MEHQETEVMTAESGTVALLNKSEIDMQIATAHKYPRSIVNFRNEVLQMVTLNEKVASECIYALPRDGKTIEGPSARFAEVVASAWGNSRAGARVVSDQGEFVTAQGVFHDLQRNVAITYEVQRRITNKGGQRFKADMIGVTANAACSIALRNAILKGVPKAFWSDMYDQARETAIGNVQTLANRRVRALGVLQKMGVTPDQVFQFLDINGEEDLTLEHLGILFGITTAIKEGDTTPEQAFSKDAAPAPAVRSKSEARAASAKQAPTVQTPDPQQQNTPPDRVSAAQDANAETGELLVVTASQVKFIKSKIDALELPESAVQAMLARIGAASLDALTFTQYDTARAELLALE